MMLQSLDQWAFQVLFALYGILGIQDIPREPSPDWTVIERWTEQPDKSYRLVIESTTVPEICRRDLSKYVVFPQTYMGQQSIYLDSHYVSTNSIGEKWDLGTMFDRPVLNCRLLSEGSVLRMEVFSYQQFFNGISRFPEVKNGFPYDAIFYSSMYLVAATVCVCLGLVGAILTRKLQSSNSTIYFLAKDAILAAFIISYSPGFLLHVGIAFIHTFMGLTLTTSFLLLIAPIFFERKKGKIILGMCLVINFGLWLTFFDLRNATQAVVVFYSIPFVVILGVSNLIIFCKKRKEFSFLEKLTYFLIFVLTIQDINVAYYSREGFFHLSILVIVISVVNFLKVINEVNRKNIDIELIRDKLIQETNLVNKLNFLHQRYRETIHDLKSPVSALNFMSSADSISNKQAVKLSSRFMEILTKIENNGLNLTLDWYLPQLFEKCIADIIYEKEGAGVSFLFYNHISLDSCEIFFDPVEVKVIVSELIDNSVKATKGDVQVSIRLTLDISLEEFSVVVTDNGPGLPADIVKNLGVKGFTTNGTGMGLFSIKRKAEEQGARVFFQNMEQGFCCKISFATRKAT
jgi:signal transduction histidine kinase